MADPSIAARSPCLDDQVIVDLIAGRLSGDSLAETERHLAACDACIELVARMTPREPADTSPPTEAGKRNVRAPADQDVKALDATPAAIHQHLAADAASDESARDAAGLDPQGNGRRKERPAPGSPPSLQPGTILRDTYRIVRHIEKGGMGEVYEASHARLSGRYAVKVLPPEFAAHQTMLSRFRREAQIASGLQHPNIVQVIDFHETDEGRPYLVMEYLDGENLAKLLARHGPFTLPEALPMIRQMAAALGAVHRQGIVHRDIKPQNVFIVPQADGSRLVKLLDFGISKGNVPSSVVTRQPALMGTPQYMAPEQALRRTEEIGPATDQFALGAIVYEMLTGKPAFEGPLISVVLYQIVHEPTPPMGGDGIFANVEPVLRRALAKSPNERYASMAEFVSALGDAAAAPIRAHTSASELETSNEHGPRVSRDPRSISNRSIPPVSAGTPLPTPARRSPLVIAALITAGAAAAVGALQVVRWISPAADVAIESAGGRKQAGGAMPASKRHDATPAPSAARSPQAQNSAAASPTGPPSSMIAPGQEATPPSSAPRASTTGDRRVQPPSAARDADPNDRREGERRPTSRRAAPSAARERHVAPTEPQPQPLRIAPALPPAPVLAPPSTTANVRVEPHAPPETPTEAAPSPPAAPPRPAAPRLVEEL